jgi:hypothetical protein
MDKQMDREMDKQMDREMDKQMDREMDKQMDREIGKKQGPDTARSWNEEWNAVYHHFIDRNASKLKGTYYAGRIVQAWQKKPEIAREAELGIANKIIARLS